MISTTFINVINGVRPNFISIIKGVQSSSMISGVYNIHQYYQGWITFINIMNIIRSVHKPLSVLSGMYNNLDQYKYKYKYLYFESIFKTKNTSWQLLIDNYTQYLQKQELFTNRCYWWHTTSFINVFRGIQPLSMLSGVYNLYQYYQIFTTIINIIWIVHKPLSVLSGMYKNLYQC